MSQVVQHLRGLRESRQLLTALISLLLAATAQAGPLQQTTVFQQGEGGYHTFRIPAIIQDNDGTLLAFAEGRVNGSGDSSNIILPFVLDGQTPAYRIRSDGGQTFPEPASVAMLSVGLIVTSARGVRGRRISARNTQMERTC